MPEHNHRAREPRPDTAHPFRGCLADLRAGKRCYPAAHGWMMLVDTCRCGWCRYVNVNGEHREYGPWFDPLAGKEER